MAVALLRLLWDGHRPVLYAEEPHGTQKNPSCQEAILKMIQQTGTQLDCPIFVQNKDGAYKDSTFASPTEENPLHSLGGSAPFDYTEHYYSFLMPKGKFNL